MQQECRCSSGEVHVMSTKPRLAERLADAISSGSYRPGEWLKQNELASTFDSTRFEIRRALEELALRKSVSHIPQKGYRVSVPSDTDVGHARAVRVILETAAARMAVEHMDDQKIAVLERLAEEFRQAIDYGTPNERSIANHRFHDAIYAHAANPLLSELIRETRDRIRGAPIYLWPSVQSMRQSAEDHDRIVAALRSGDRLAIVEAVRLHIEKGPN
jgi:DNA-binding GntR family transcriptional regulator